MLRTDLFASPPATILDVGCGHGRAVKAIADDGWKVVAFDADVAWVREAVGRAPGAVGCVGDARHLPFRGGSVAGAVAMEIIEHLDQPAELINEIRRVVRPSGALMVTVPNGALERVYRRLNSAYWQTTTHEHIFSRRQLASLLRASGLDVVRVQSAGFEWTLRWLVHSFLRTRFDATGETHNHVRVAGAMDGLFRALRRSMLARKALAAAGKLVGKSHVAECRC